MSYSASRHPRRRSVWICMTPMIDITFLLLTFFMLTSHLASAEKSEIDLPRPDDSQAVDRRFPDRIIINVGYRGDSAGPELKLGPVTIGSAGELADRLGELARVNRDAQVILRADRRLAYGIVRQIMEIVAANGLTRLQVVAELPQG